MLRCKVGIQEINIGETKGNPDNECCERNYNNSWYEVSSDFVSNLIVEKLKNHQVCSIKYAFYIKIIKPIQGY